MGYLRGPGLQEPQREGLPQGKDPRRGRGQGGSEASFLGPLEKRSKEGSLEAAWELTVRDKHCKKTVKCEGVITCHKVTGDKVLGY